MLGRCAAQPDRTASFRVELAIIPLQPVPTPANNEISGCSDFLETMQKNRTELAPRGDTLMKKVVAGVAVAVALLAARSADAGWYCGAASYDCCPATACQPTSCYTSCRVERQTC